MTVFADSSVVVTLYAEEVGRKHLIGQSAIVVSQLLRVEVPAALWRKHRAGELSTVATHALVASFEADYIGTPVERPRFAIVLPITGILASAARSSATHGLRAYDAVQLASAVAARASDADCDTSAAYDRPLRRAAAAEGFRLLPT